MSKIRLLFIVFLVLCFSACKRRKPNQEQTKIKTYNIDVDNCYDNRLSDCLEIEKIIPLETTTESLIKRVSRVHVNNNEIIVFDRSSDNVLRFDDKGRFIGSVGAKGKGPNEYLQITDCYISKSHDTIAIYDGFKNSVCFYNRDNEVVKNQKVESFFGDVCIWNNKQVLYFGRKNRNIPPKTKASNLCIYDFNGRLLNEAFFYDRNEFTQTRFKKYNSLYTLKDGSINIQRYFNDTIFIYDGKKITPRLYFDLGEYKLPFKEKQEKLKKAQKDYRKFMKLISKNRYFVNNRSIWLETDDFIYTKRRSTKSAVIHIIIDKKTDKVFVNNYMSQPLVWKSLTTPIGVAFKDDNAYLVFVLRSTSLPKYEGKYKKEFDWYKENFPEEAKLFQEKMRTVDKNDNPCLVLAKFKGNE